MQSLSSYQRYFSQSEDTPFLKLFLNFSLCWVPLTVGLSLLAMGGLHIAVLLLWHTLGFSQTVTGVLHKIISLKEGSTASSDPGGGGHIAENGIFTSCRLKTDFHCCNPSMNLFQRPMEPCSFYEYMC